MARIVEGSHAKAHDPRSIFHSSKILNRNIKVDTGTLPEIRRSQIRANPGSGALQKSLNIVYRKNEYNRV
jgi:hypothetical protein